MVNFIFVRNERCFYSGRCTLEYLMNMHSTASSSFIISLSYSYSRGLCNCTSVFCGIYKNIAMHGDKSK